MSVNAADYFKKFPKLPPNEIKQLAEHFNGIAGNDGEIDANEVQTMFKEMGQNITIQQAKDHIAIYDKDHNGTLNFEEFLEIFVQEQEGKKSALSEGLRQHKLVKLKGQGGGEHAYSQEEVSGFVMHINATLSTDPDLKEILPINPENDELFKKLGDGLLLCKLVNLAQPDTVDERVIAKGKKLNNYSAAGNITLGLNSAKSIGINVVNIGNTDIRDGTPHLILGLTWQLVKMSLLKSISLNNVPELVRLLKPGETLADLLKLSPEQILLRWMNFHLEAAGSNKVVKNFTTDISDSEAVTIVLKQVAPESCGMKPMSESDLMKRAELMLQEADKINCRKFVGPKEIVKGNQRLNLAFIATIFNTRHGLQQLTEKELAGLEEALFAAGGTRIERQYCLWMNSCGVDPFIVNLYDGLQDGLILLQMFDRKIGRAHV